MLAVRCPLGVLLVPAVRALKKKIQIYAQGLFM